MAKKQEKKEKKDRIDKFLDKAQKFTDDVFKELLKNGSK
jgi:hypothetical protein